MLASEPNRRRRWKALWGASLISLASKTHLKNRLTPKESNPHFANMPVQWIIEAKREATRSRRLQTAIKQIAESKSQNWKYANF